MTNRRTMPKATLRAILRRLANGERAGDIAKRIKNVNAQQIGAIITNVRNGVYDEEYNDLVGRILANV